MSISIKVHERADRNVHLWHLSTAECALAPTPTHISTHDYRSSRIHAPDLRRQTASRITNLRRMTQRNQNFILR